MAPIEHKVWYKTTILELGSLPVKCPWHNYETIFHFNSWWWWLCVWSIRFLLRCSQFNMALFFKASIFFTFIAIENFSIIRTIFHKLDKGPLVFESQFKLLGLLLEFLWLFLATIMLRWIQILLQMIFDGFFFISNTFEILAFQFKLKIGQNQIIGAK